MTKEDKVLDVMNRLDLDIMENGLLTAAVLEEIWDEAIDWYKVLLEFPETLGHAAARELMKK